MNKPRCINGFTRHHWVSKMGGIICSRCHTMRNKNAKPWTPPKPKGTGKRKVVAQ